MIKKRVIWLFGLSGAGKTTLSHLLAEKLENLGLNVVLLDGDDLRAGLNADLGFSNADRAENIRRASHIASLLVKRDIVCIGSFITPLNDHRQLISQIVGDELLLVYLDCPTSECERRDVKGLYRQARNNAIADFTGISAAFELPNAAVLSINTQHHTPEECVDMLLRELTG
ncbi:adenylyl-sulfate kinase [Parapedobacter koreensis]|uniref:Adenylyl-sulfate kinase n=1 Tax=Parapedobacter koreensis TaxID=332977 RepID=A0A1H7S673_9SPHI|nr:adenylyl-sulfate kinase [Parapedobacter koreensis]SEL67779.1 adenylylsulfate kinase [Parapedobacter koreensis]